MTVLGVTVNPNDVFLLPDDDAARIRAGLPYVRDQGRNLPAIISVPTAAHQTSLGLTP
jgi:hypothetical protein